ncbi:hypothetical protein RUND412_003918 [Rhizina undulata]
MLKNVEEGEEAISGFDGLSLESIESPKLAKEEFEQLLREQKKKFKARSPTNFLTNGAQKDSHGMPKTEEEEEEAVSGLDGLILESIESPKLVKEKFEHLLEQEKEFKARKKD